MAATGGARPGAGRPKGSLSRRSKEQIEKAEKGLTPLEYMLSIMRDIKQPQLRREAMATAAAPYCHHRLATHQFQGDPGAPVYFIIKNKPPKGEK